MRGRYLVPATGLILAGLLGTACGGSDGGTGPSADLAGTVREATRATPVGGATVSLGSRTTTTAADGTYELLGVPTGAVTLVVTAPGYEPASQAVSVQAGANQRDVQLSVKTWYQYGSHAAYIPPFVETLRGILFIVGGAGTNARSIDVIPGHPDPCTHSFCGLESSLLAFANAQDFALVGEDVTDATWQTYTSGTQVVGTALSTLPAAAPHHPELQHAPVLLLGLSWGGCKAYEYVAASPQRVIGFITVKGGCHPESAQPAARPVPGYLFIGGDDTNSRIENITEAFEANRPSGARWALAVEQGAGHTVPSASVMFQWMTVVTSLRLPASVTPGQPVALLPIAEGDGWLGNRTTFEICAFACYTGDAGQAAWLPSADAASQWQSFVSATGGGGGGGEL